MLERFSEKALAGWMTASHRKPSVLRGARQVGKSILVRQFALHQGFDLCEINLERHLSLERVFGSLGRRDHRGARGALPDTDP